MAQAYGPSRSKHEEFVDAIMETKRVREEFVRRHVRLGHRGFEEMWELALAPVLEHEP